MKLFITIILIFFIHACYGTDDKIDEFWVNTDIDWFNPNTGDPEIDSLMEASTIISIYFSNESNTFVAISSNGSLSDKDTIYQHVEIYKLLEGRWNYIDKNILELNYKQTDFLIDSSLSQNATINKKLTVQNNNGTQYLTGKLLNKTFVSASKLSQKDKKRLKKLLIIYNNK